MSTKFCTDACSPPHFYCRRCSPRGDGLSIPSYDEALMAQRRAEKEAPLLLERSRWQKAKDLVTGTAKAPTLPGPAFQKTSSGDQPNQKE